jgi:UDP-glucuronate 4-epimerase
MAILVTGTAGFIGFHLAHKLLQQGQQVIGLDNVNNYYDPALKEARLQILADYNDFTFYRRDLCDKEALDQIFKSHAIEQVVHLAAQAGVRYSLTNPYAYQKSNLEGFLNIIEAAKTAKITNFIFASSSSVYGNNTKLPFSVTDSVDHPISLYAATKRANELIAHTYAHLYQLPCTGFRFFTVYGPWGRPDMALFIFTRNILANQPIDVYNFGKMRRDFTYIDDIIAGLLAAIQKPFPFAIFNLGNHRSENLLDFIHLIEEYTGKKATIRYLPLQPGDVPETYADITETTAQLGFYPRTNIQEGIKYFLDWYYQYYHIQ